MDPMYFGWLVLAYGLGYFTRVSIQKYDAWSRHRDFRRRMASLLGPNWDKEEDLDPPKINLTPGQIDEMLGDRDYVESLP